METTAAGTPEVPDAGPGPPLNPVSLGSVLPLLSGAGKRPPGYVCYVTVLAGAPVTPYLPRRPVSWVIVSPSPDATVGDEGGSIRSSGFLSW